MSRTTRWITTLLGAGLVMIFVACGTDSAASGASDSPRPPATSVPSKVVNSVPVVDQTDDDHEEATVEAHVGDVHDEPDEGAHTAQSPVTGKLE